LVVAVVEAPSTEEVVGQEDLDTLLLSHYLLAPILLSEVVVALADQMLVVINLLQILALLHILLLLVL
jgi:hypothetical protein